jgi:predicted Zn-dependent protease
MRNLLAIIALATVVGSPIISYAQEKTPDTPAKPEQKAETQEQKDIKKYEEKIKDLPKFEGEFTFYQRKNEILLEIPESKLGQLFCAQATVSKGVGMDGIQAGDPLNQEAIDVYEFRRGPGDDIQIVKPNLKFRFKPEDPLAIASARSFPDAILDNYSIEATHPTKKLILINATEFFQGELFGIRTIISGAAGTGYSPDRQNFSVGSIKTFPENAVVQYNIHYKKSGGDDDLAALLAALLGLSGPPVADSRSLPLTISYNLWYRKNTGYTPRYADPRVGFFTTDYFDVAKLKQPDRSTKLIERFNLVKKDPSAAVSEPVEPITWYLDKSIPEEYKQGVKDGILYWNKAYEAIGFKNALIVKDAPDDKDFDHADGRYNLIRWTMTENSAYAVAWFRADPISGQIMNAAVTVDANYPASAFTEFREQVVGSSSKTPWSDSEDKQQLIQKLVNKPLSEAGFHKIGCDHAHGLAEQAAYGYNLMLANNVPVDAKEYSRIMIADLVAHEVGHCLGLRHNFAASTLHTTEQLKDLDLINKTGVSASVMDYVGLNVQAVLAGNKGYYNPTIGAYDLWAIEYGYQQYPGFNQDGEKYYLNELARKYGQPGLLYLTDEDADGQNPLSVRWDLGSDNLNYIKVQTQADQLLRNYALNGATAYGESYTRRNSLILRTIRGQFRNAGVATRMVGGFEFRRHFKGDLAEKPTLKPVDPKAQREAMLFVAQTALAVDSLNLPQDVLYSLSQDPEKGGSDYNAPLREYIARQQMLIVAELLSSDKLDEITENDFKIKGNVPRYTLSDHYNIICSSIFDEVAKAQNIKPLRRDLQRYVVEQLIKQAASSSSTLNSDAILLSNSWLETLHAQFIAAQKNTKLDELTKLHNKDLAKKIGQALEPNMADKR